MLFIKKKYFIVFAGLCGSVFSLLSMLIVLALMVVFLGDMNSENVVEALAEFGGMRDTQADQANADYLIQMWTLAGILVVNTVTVTLTVMGKMVEDQADRQACKLLRYAGEAGQNYS